jgi:hypothetical protein
MVVPPDREQERRYAWLLESLVLVDLHQHPLVLPEDLSELFDYFRSRDYTWGFHAVRAGSWTAVAAADMLSGFGLASDEDPPIVLTERKKCTKL